MGCQGTTVMQTLRDLSACDLPADALQQAIGAARRAGAVSAALAAELTQIGLARQ